jgi:hypothetical protein
MHNPDDVPNPHNASSVAMPIDNTMTDGLLRQYEEDRREELTVKRKEKEFTCASQSKIIKPF